MGLYLEELESRCLPDAALANAYATQVVPVLEAVNNVITQSAYQFAEAVVNVAEREAEQLGPAFAAGNLPAVLSAADKLLSALPSEVAAFNEQIAATYVQLYQEPQLTGYATAPYYGDSYSYQYWYEYDYGGH